MLFFLLVFLFSSAVYSLPVQENCDKSLHAFHDCLKNRFLELPRRNNDSSVAFQKWRSIFVQCGAEQSECYLQKKLMKMIDKLIPVVEKLEKLPEIHSIVKEVPSCYNENEKTYGETCRKYAYDQHGLELRAGRYSSMEVNCCLANYFKEVCTIDELEILPLLPILHEIRFYARHLRNFHEFVEMNHAANASIQIPTVEVFSDECKKAENEFHDCLQSYHEELSIRNGSQYSTQKEVFSKCGAEESECYLQKQLLTWLDAVIGATDQRVDFVGVEDHYNCTMQIFKMYSLECKRERFDKYGFEKPRTPYQYYNSICEAKYSRQLCSPNIVTLLNKQAQYEKVEAYKYNLDKFVEYVTKGYRYMEVDERVARKMEKFVSF